MKRKFSTLLFAIVVNATTFSQSCGELFKIQQAGQNSATLSGVYEGEAKASFASQTSVYEGIMGRKLGSTNHYLGVDLAEGFSLQAGDIVTVFVTTESSKLQLFSDLGNTLIAETDNVNLGKNDIVLDERANNVNGLYLYRTNSDVNPYVSYISVYRFCPVSEPTITVSANNISLNASPLNPSKAKVIITGQMLTPGVYDLSLTDVNGLSVYPDSVVVTNSGNFRKEVEITYTCDKNVETSLAELSLTIDNIEAVVSIEYSATSKVTGICSENLSWALETLDSTLVLEGTGDMADFGSLSSVPWYDYTSYIAHVIINEGVTRIGTKAFSYCSNLVSVEFARSITTIRVDAFSYCPKLLKVLIPSNITYISKYAFKGCNRLKTIILEDTDSRFIGEGIFANCPSLLTVISNCEYPPTIDATVFDGCGDLSLVDCYVPDGSVVLYKKHDVWKAFNIKAMSEKPGEPGTQAGVYTVAYIDAESNPLSNEIVTLHVPVAPEIDGFTFLKWDVTGDLTIGITIQAVYTANMPTSAPTTYTNPANPAQTLIRNGNVYILSDDKTYTITGQAVK